MIELWEYGKLVSQVEQCLDYPRNNRTTLLLLIDRSTKVGFLKRSMIYLIKQYERGDKSDVRATRNP